MSGLTKVFKGLKKAGKKQKIKDLKVNKIKSLLGPAETKSSRQSIKSKSSSSGATISSGKLAQDQANTKTAKLRGTVKPFAGLKANAAKRSSFTDASGKTGVTRMNKTLAKNTKRNLKVNLKNRKKDEASKRKK